MTAKFLSAAALGLLLAACGGDDGDPVAPVVDNTVVPASATASPVAFTSYTRSLDASETAEPLDVDGVNPPTSEAEEPADI